MPRAAAPSMVQEAFSEYHLYTLGRRTTIANQETKQLALLNGTGVPVEKRYVVDGQSFYYRNRRSPGTPIKDNVQVFYRLRNDAKSGLGAPMPAGVVRVYQADSKGGLQFVGEDRIDHTPKDETLDLKIGNAFDIVCERNQTDFEKISDTVYEMEFAITLRNHKTTPDRRAGERAGRRHLAHDPVDARVAEDRGVGRAVHGARPGRRHRDPQVPGAGDVLSRRASPGSWPAGRSSCAQAGRRRSAERCRGTARKDPPPGARCHGDRFV